MNQQQDDQSSTAVDRTRGRVLTVLLVLLGASTGIASVVNLAGSRSIANSLPNAPSWAVAGILGLGVLGLLMLVGIVAIWMWKKWGAYLLAAVVVLVFAINFLLIGGAAPIIGLIGGGSVLFFVSRQWRDFE